MPLRRSHVRNSGKTDYVIACNCSVCRRLATHWAHSNRINVALNAPESSTYTYVWGDKSIKFHTCKTCGCPTHWMAIDKSMFAVNCNLASTQDMQNIRVRHLNGADTWEYLD